MRRGNVIVLALFLAGSRTAAGAGTAEEPRARLYLNGTFASGSLDFSERRTFEEFQEDGTIDTQYADKTGPGFEIGLQYRLARHWGVAAGFYLSKRDGKASYDAALPHPLYLDKPRQAAGEVSGLRYKENAGLLDLVFTTSSGSFDFTLAGGATLFKVESDLLQEIHYTHSYPYDTVTVTDVSKASFTHNAFGFNVSGGLDYRVSRHFGFGGLARYLRGTVALVPSAGNKTTIKAGGLQFAGGVRLYF